MSSSVSTSDPDYLQPAEIPPYLELLSASPELPRKSNDYERISNIRRDRNHPASPNTRQEELTQSNSARDTVTSCKSLTPTSGSTSRKSLHSSGISPAINRRPVPPIPQQGTTLQSERKEYFC